MSAARYLRARKVVDRQIKKWGQKAVLRRTSGDRECWVCEVQFTAIERQKMKNPTHRVFSISAENEDMLALPPSRSEDSLILFIQPAGVTELPPLRQVAPVSPLAAGGIVVYWDITVE